MSIRPIGTHQHQGKCSHLDNYKQIRKSVLVKHAFKGHLFTKSTFVSPPSFQRKYVVFFFLHISTKVLHNLDTNSVQMINKIYGQPRPLIHTCDPAPSWREQGSKTCSAGVEHLHPQSLFRGPSGILNLLLASSAKASITCFSKRGAPMLRFELGSRV